MNFVPQEDINLRLTSNNEDVYDITDKNAKQKKEMWGRRQKQVKFLRKQTRGMVGVCGQDLTNRMGLPKRIWVINRDVW